MRLKAPLEQRFSPCLLAREPMSLISTLSPSLSPSSYVSQLVRPLLVPLSFLLSIVPQAHIVDHRPDRRGRCMKRSGSSGPDGCAAELSFGWWYSLQDHALLLLLLAGQQRGARGVLEDLPHALVGLGGALEVLLCANLLADVLSLEVRWSVHVHAWTSRAARCAV